MRQYIRLASGMSNGDRWDEYYFVIPAAHIPRLPEKLKERITYEWLMRHPFISGKGYYDALLSMDNEKSGLIRGYTVVKDPAPTMTFTTTIIVPPRYVLIGTVIICNADGIPQPVDPTGCVILRKGGKQKIR